MAFDDNPKLNFVLNGPLKTPMTATRRRTSVRELDSAPRLTPEHHDLVPQRRLLRLKLTF